MRFIKKSLFVAGLVNMDSNTAQMVEAGSLNRSLMVKTRNEIESMAKSFNIITINIRKMVEKLQHKIIERKQTEAPLGLKHTMAELARSNITSVQLKSFSIEVKSFGWEYIWLNSNSLIYNNYLQKRGERTSQICKHYKNL